MLLRLLGFALVLMMIPLIRRVLVTLFAGLLGRQARARHLCPRCHGAGWLATGDGLKKACGCGSSPPEAQGPIVDVDKDDRSVN